MDGPVAVVRWIGCKLMQMHSEDDAGTVLSSTRVDTSWVLVLVSLLVFAMVAYVFFALLREHKAPDSTVVGALVGGITALGGVVGWLNKNRNSSDS